MSRNWFNDVSSLAEALGRLSLALNMAPRSIQAGWLHAPKPAVPKSSRTTGQTRTGKREQARHLRRIAAGQITESNGLVRGGK